MAKVYEKCVSLNYKPESYLLLGLMLKILGFVRHSEHLCKSLRRKNRVSRICNLDFFLGAVFARDARFPFGLW